MKKLAQKIKKISVATCIILAGVVVFFPSLFEIATHAIALAL